MTNKLHHIYIPTWLNFKTLFSFDNFRFIEAVRFFKAQVKDIL